MNAISHIAGAHSRTVVRAASLGVIVLGAWALLGWALDIPLLESWVPGFVTMKVNTAVAFLLAGTSALVQVTSTPSRRRQQASGVCASAVIAVGSLTLAEYIFQVDLRIDRILLGTRSLDAHASNPWRMAVSTAVSFALIGLALLVANARTAALRSLSGGLAIVALFIGYVTMTGYALSREAPFGVTGFDPMAVPTAVGFVALAIGVLALRPGEGVVAIVAQDNSAGVGLRRLLPLILAVPLAVAWIRIKGQQAGLYGPEFGLGLTVTVTTGMIASLALWNARAQGAWETERRLATEQFRSAIEAAPTGMLMVDGTGRIVLVNALVERLFGYPREELLGQSLELLVPARFRSGHAENRASFVSAPSVRPMGAGRDLHGVRKDGREIPVEIALTPIETSAGRFVLSSIQDIAERKRTEREKEELLEELRRLNLALEQRVQARTADLTATLREREVLLQEVHHRVKNNLYVIASLMEMQARLLQPGEGRDALADCQGRVHAIALIHEKLYLSRDYANVPFADYLRGLAGDVFHATGVSGARVSLEFAADDLPITLEKAIPCGLILNELITNALKHAFPGERRGTVRVEWKQAAPGRVRLTVADDGIGLPPELENHATKSLGLRLVETLAKQIEATLTIDRAGGTRFDLMFSAEGGAG